MQGNLKAAVKIIGMAIFTSILCMFIQISFFSMMKSFSTEVVGYKVYEVMDGEKDKYHGVISVDEYPEDPKENFKYMAVYSEMPDSAKAVETVLSTVCCLGVLFCTTGTVFATVAARDRNDCDFNGAEPNKNKGFFMALFAAIPPFVFWLLTLILHPFKSKAVNWFYWVYHWIIMGPVKPITDLLTSTEVDRFTVSGKTYIVTGAQTDLSSIPLWAIAVQIGFIILFVLYGYLMYRICYNEDSVISKLLYKSARKDENVRRLGGR